MSRRAEYGALFDVGIEYAVFTVFEAVSLKISGARRLWNCLEPWFQPLEDLFKDPVGRDSGCSPPWNIFGARTAESMPFFSLRQEVVNLPCTFLRPILCSAPLFGEVTYPPTGALSPVFLS